MTRQSHQRTAAAQRQQIAARAAQLLAEDHIGDFTQAKRKAARQLGIHESRSLPSDQEIEAALASHRAVYDPGHTAVVQAFRRKAANLMRFLDGFRPKLTGSVLSGVAGPHSNINLILFHDNPKAVEFFLLNQRIDYEQRESPGSPRQADYPTLAFWYDDTPVLLHVRPLSAERSLREERATLADVERLLAQDTAMADRP